MISWVQPDILEKVNSFRMKRHATDCDIEKMYLQIRIAETDRDYQRFLWREHEHERMHDYCLTTVTFGQASAPFLAVRTLHQLSIDCSVKYPLASSVLHDCCYVDDIHISSDTVPEAKKCIAQLRMALKEAGFELREWVSNEEAVLYDIPTEHRAMGRTHKFLG